MSKKEFKVRAPGSDRSLHKLMLGKFPEYEPDIRGKGTWYLGQGERAGAQEWLLQNKEHDESLRGAPEGGLTGSVPSTYFVLLKQKGSDEFIAIPVNEWTTFKRVHRGREAVTLEEAEAAMKQRRMAAAAATQTRLGQAVAPMEAQTEEKEGEPDSDEEWKGITVRAANQAPLMMPSRLRDRAKPLEEEEEDDRNEQGLDGQVYVPRPRDAEDWEHEPEAADDDVDMGDIPAEGEEGEQGVQEGGTEGVAKVRMNIRRLMKETGLEDSGDSSEEDDEDEEDLDEMAAADEGPVITKEEEEEAKPRKRKAESPPKESSVAGSKKEEKKARVDGPPTAQEIKSLLESRGRMSLKELTAEFGPRLKTVEEKKAFTAAVKSVARLDPTASQSGIKYLIPK